MESTPGSQSSTKTATENSVHLLVVSGDDREEEEELRPPFHTHGEELEKGSSS